METVYEKNGYQVREIDGLFYPVQIINGQAYGVGMDCWGGLTESGHPGNEAVIKSIASPRKTRSAAVATIKRSDR